MSLVLDEHREYLADAPRIAAFRAALAEVVRPGDVVLDLGAGTGILGLMACSAGAARVYAIDEGPIVGLAREIAAANGLAGRIVSVHGLSTRVALPERVDVVVADQIGRFGFEAGIFQFFDDARARFLKPGGRLVPEEIRLYVAAVQCPELSARVEFWAGRPAGYDFTPARAIAANTGYPARFGGEHLIGAPVCALALPLAAPAARTLVADVSLIASHAATLHGLAGWFEAQLSPSTILTNSPLAAQAINRRQVYLPIARPVAVQPGTEIRVRLRVLPGEALLAWTVEVTTPPARFVHSTLQGMLLCREDLARTDPHWVPVLSPWGEARRSVLELCDGRRPLADVEREVHARHPALFATAAEAAAFVTEVVTRYAR